MPVGGPRESRASLFSAPYVTIHPPPRRGIRFSKEELRHIVMASGALITAFTLAFLDPLRRTFTAGGALQIAVSATVAVLTGFLLHELAHKVLAQRYGAWAEFRSSPGGLVLAVFTGVLGFVFAAPGAVYIAGSLSKGQNGRVSLAGPLTNFAIALAFLGSFLAFRPFLGGGLAGWVGTILYFTAYINLFLGGFNMIPIPPLDGSKIIAWNRTVWILTLIAIGAVFVGVLLL
ncbi:MAG TPA: site-2 protease family protein [Thermoplasmata archaeon]|nr:site-2 protease family protein [Thermoplasmata archaeon]